MPITEQFKQIFSNDYCGFDTFFEKVLAPLFGDKIERKNENLLTDDRYRDKAEKLNIKTMTFVALVEAFDPINVIDITVDNSCNLARSRVYIKELVRQMLENYAQAFIIFHYENVEDMPWRFSYIYKEGRQTDVTAPKRFTYVFGRNYSGRTAAERFATLQGKPMDSADDFKVAFSVESLSDEFFYNYRAIYANFVQYITGKRIVKKGSEWKEDKIHEPNETLYNAFNRDDKRIRDYIKKTLGRLTFLYFVERKGWLNNNRNFMRQLFDNSKYKDDFLDCVLEPLFYTILNTAPDNRRAIFEQHNENRDCEKEVEWDIDLLDQWKDIPFLNGGLFERDDDDVVRTQFPAIFFSNPNGVENYAGKEKDRIPGRDYDWRQVPGLLDFFGQYNFTIDENDPNDAEVGVDPEMLGRIFENLLEDNKDKGAFYTPKEIVQYMCRESLIAYLQTDAADDAHRERLRRFVETHDATILHDAEYVCKKIEDVKICDPAIGSGAFPMGLLNELVACREALGLHIDKEVNRAEIKKHIIQNSIYGVDIEKGAVDIARLRFWLSIVVDEESSLTLPNLDYKIMQGNSLLESFMGVDLSRILPENTTSGVLAFDDETAQQTLLYEKLHRYFDTGKHSEKAKLRSDIDNLVKGLVKVRTAGRDDITNALANFDVSGNDQFFLWHTWFHDVFSRPSKEGFDIVIGNPPYVKEYVNRHAFDGFRETSPYYMGKMDLWYGFACHGIDLLCQDGHLCFIAQNNWTTSAGAKKMRNKIVNDARILQLLDFNTFMVFESADIQTMIMLFEKNQTMDNYGLDYRILMEDATKEDMLALLNKQIRRTTYRTQKFSRTKFANKLFTFSESDVIFEKISENKVYFQDDEVAQGIVFPQDFLDKKGAAKLEYKFPIGSGIFGLSYDEKNKLGLSDNEKRIIKPYFTTEQIGRYYTIPSNSKWLIYTDSSFKQVNSMDNYPHIKAHLDQFIDIITSSNKPYGLHRCRKEKFFQGEKIISLRKCVERPCFSYSDFDCYVTQTFFSIKTSRWDMKFLTGVLNSKLVEFWLRHKGKMQGSNFQVDKEPLQGIPLPIVESSQQQSIIEIVEKILAAKKANPQADTSAEEKEIDRLVYALYGLTEEEIKVVEGK